MTPRRWATTTRLWAYRYLAARDGEHCAICHAGPTTRNTPPTRDSTTRNGSTTQNTLDIDHIDGDPENNHPDNLRLLCRQCNVATSNKSNPRKRDSSDLREREKGREAGNTNIQERCKLQRGKLGDAGQPAIRSTIQTVADAQGHSRRRLRPDHRNSRRGRAGRMLTAHNRQVHHKTHITLGTAHGNGRRPIPSHPCPQAPSPKPAPRSQYAVQKTNPTSFRAKRRISLTSYVPPQPHALDLVANTHSPRLKLRFVHVEGILAQRIPPEVNRGA